MNIICVVFDSLRKDCTECYGHPFWGEVETPHLKKFAGESLVFNNAYPESLPTLPARKAIYTGKRVYPFVNGDIRHRGDFIGAAGWGPISEKDDTLAEVLSAAGYRTCLISSVYPQFKPSKNYWRGFDQWHFVRGKENDPYKSGPKPAKEEINRYLPREILESPNKFCPDGTLIRDFVKDVLQNISPIRYEEDYPAAQVMLESARWLQENRDAENFFLMVESFDPHESWNIPSYYRQIYDKSASREQILSLYADASVLTKELLKRTQANYSGLVTMCDRWFGYLCESVEKMGLLDNTVIIVTSDHGHSIGDKNYLGKRGYPSSREVFEIPLFVRHPEGRGRGRRSDIMVQHHDLFPLILRFAGEKYHEDAKNNIEGKDFWEEALINDTDFRKHVTVGWDSAVTVIEGKWWFNTRVNGRGPFLHDKETDPFLEKNVAPGNEEVTNRLFSLAVKDAGGKFPEYLVAKAEKMEDVPGCSPIAAKVPRREN